MRKLARQIAALVFAITSAIGPVRAADSGWSTSNFLRASSAVLSSMPISMCAWAKTSITGTSQDIGGIFNSGSGVNRNSWFLQEDSANNIEARTGNASTASSAVTSTTVSANTWFSACAIFTSATSRTVYLNGGGVGTDNTNLTPSGMNRTSIGVGDASPTTQPWAPSGTGSIAWFAIWSVTLTSADVTMYANGVDPRLIEPSSLVAFWPLEAVFPEVNYLSATTMAQQGTLTFTADPPLFRVGSNAQ